MKKANLMKRRFIRLYFTTDKSAEQSPAKIMYLESSWNILQNQRKDKALSNK